MKLLTSPMGIALIGALIHAAIMTVLLMNALNAVPKAQVEFPEKTQLPERMWNFKTQAIDELVSELKAARAKSEKEDKSVIALKAQIDAEKIETEHVRTEILALRAEIEKRVLEIQDSEMKNLKTLSATYSKAKVTEAVAIFREMDENMAVKILSMMKPENVAPILGEMTKAPARPGEESMARRAARISDKLRLIKPIEKKAA